MKILVLSFYYEPDLSAGSFRTTALVRELARLVPIEASIDVLATLPNRYRTFTAEAPQLEYRSGITICRVALPGHRSGMVDQAKAFFVFSRQALKHLSASGDYDVVYATSSRLMTAVLGSWIARKKAALLYLDIRDIFVDTIKDVLPWSFALLAKPLFSSLERWAVQGAAKVNLVSEGFLGYFNARYPGMSFSCFMNGIDDEFIVAARETATKKKEIEWPLTVLYAGNIGEGQGLHIILPVLAKRMRGKMCFKVIGDGGRKEALCAALATAGVDNVELIEPLKRGQLIQAYKDADILFLHLNDYDAFKKVLPSKLFEYAAMGKPIWAGVSGYAAEFVRSEIENSAVFHPCNVLEAEKVFATLDLQEMPRADFINKYGRQKMMRGLAIDILSIAEKGN